MRKIIQPTPKWLNPRKNGKCIFRNEWVCNLYGVAFYLNFFWFDYGTTHFWFFFHKERMRKSMCNQSITIASLRDTVISQRNRLSSQSERMQNIQRKLEVKIVNSFNVKIVIENFINFRDVLKLRGKNKIIMFIARTLLIKLRILWSQDTHVFKQ